MRANGVAGMTRTRLVAAAVAATAALTGCAGSSASGGSSSGGKSIDDLNNELLSWKTPYEQTTCKQWLGEMTGTEKAVAAQQMLARMRTKDAPAAEPASTDMVATFAGGITNACGPIPTLTLTDAAAGLYLTERARFEP